MNKDEYISTETETFHEALRSCVSIFLIFIILLIIAHVIISKLKIKQSDDLFFISRNDECAYQVALLTCTFSVAIALAAIALLPISIISNEIVLKYPRSYYMQWINTSLIQNLWNSVSLSSNLTVFLLMPFATLFLDSEGFSGMRSNIHNRIMEAICFLLVTIFLVLGVVWILCIPFRDNQSLFASLRDLWQFYLPLVHSSVSLIGVVLLCVLSPLGCLHAFLKLGAWLKGVYQKQPARPTDSIKSIVESAHFIRQLRFSRQTQSSESFHYNENMSCNPRLYVVEIVAYLVALLTVTAIVVLVICYVVINIVGIIAGLHALPESHSQIRLGEHPSSSLGWFGVLLQITVINSLLLSSLLALYNNCPMNTLQPRSHNTDIHTLMKNAMCLLMLSSASPIQSRLLGVTAFNPLGTFGHLDWLNSGVLVLTYNIVFLGLLGLGTIRHVINISLNERVVVNSVRDVITYTSPTVVRIFLADNIRYKNDMKTA